MRAVVLLIALGACGRLSFDPRADSSDAIQFDPADCPASYTETFASTGHVYRIEMNQVSWAEAVAACRADQVSPGAHTHLIVLGGDAELQDATQRLDDAWLGLSDRRVERTFLAITLEDIGGYPAIGSTAWGIGEPSDFSGGENCAQVRPLMEINDLPCTTEIRPFLCECDPYPDTPSQY